MTAHCDILQDMLPSEDGVSYAEREHRIRKFRHDANGHLRGVVELTRLLRRRVQGDADTQEMLRLVLQSGEEARRLIDGLADYGLMRITQPVFNVMNVDDICTEVLSVTQEAFPDKIYHPELHVIGTLRADMDMIRILFCCVLDNAFRYHKGTKDGHIRIAAHRADGICSVTVSDNGIGMKRDYFKRAFLPMERMQNHSDFPGSGMGLATAEHIMRLHGGTIMFIAPEQGYKTTLRMDFPDA